jgi:hypothetical protein
MNRLNTSGQALAPSRSRIFLLKRQLQTLQQGTKNCTDYLHQAKSWANQLSAMGKPVDDDDLISFVINGLNPAYNSFITVFFLAVRDREMSFADFQSVLLSHEILLERQQHQTISPRSPCQICGKSNHQALDCYHRMDYSYQGRHPPSQLAAMVAQTNAEFENQDWFADIGASAHITPQAENIMPGSRLR